MSDKRTEYRAMAATLRAVLSTETFLRLRDLMRQDPGGMNLFAAVTNLCGPSEESLKPTIKMPKVGGPST